MIRISLALAFLGITILTAQQPGGAAKVSNPELLKGTRISDKDLESKKEGTFITGFPLVNSDPDAGVGYGARVYWFNNGKRSDPLFAYTPYKERIFAQYFATTNDLQYHWIDFDSPDALGSGFRIRTGLIYDRNPAANYFGVGRRSLQGLKDPFSGQSYDSFTDYTEALQEVNGGISNSKFNKVTITRPELRFSLEREMPFQLRPIIGFQISKVSIDDYSGKDDPFNSGAKLGNTQLRQDADAGRVNGFNGGWDNSIRFGIAYDSRDFEPDPRSGIFSDINVHTRGSFVGSSFDYTRYIMAHRMYYSPFRNYGLVLAGRAVYVTTTGTIPFYSMDIMAFNDGFRSGLGGIRTLRGYRQNRFMGPVMAFANLEIRWSMFEIETGGQTFKFMLVPFVDFANVYDRDAYVSSKGFKTTYGSALRVAWNQSTVIAADYGVSEEGSTLYINFDHIF